MKRIAYLTLLIAATLFSGCSKIDVESKDLEGSFWSGTLYHSDYPSDEFDSIHFYFDKGHADFTYLEYACNLTEEGVMIYEVSGTEMTISKANELLDGLWTITYKRGEKMIMEKNHESNVLTIDIVQRR